MLSVLETSDSAAEQRSRALHIMVAQGTGEGPTALAAFDAALLEAGVANYNLVPLSSVIPPRSRLTRGRHATPAHHYGRRLYVVMAQMRESRPGHLAAAGLGWVQEQESGCGLFVEMHGPEAVRLEGELHTTLAAMTRARAVDYGPAHTAIVHRRCVDRPVCALVIAVYACEPW